MKIELTEDWSDNPNHPKRGDVLITKTSDWDECNECNAYYAQWPEDGEFYLVYDYECIEVEE